MDYKWIGGGFATGHPWTRELDFTTMIGFDVILMFERWFEYV